MDKRPVTKSVPKLCTESGRSRSERWTPVLLPTLSDVDKDVPIRANGSTLVSELKLDWGLSVLCDPSRAGPRRMDAAVESSRCGVDARESIKSIGGVRKWDGRVCWECVEEEDELAEAFRRRVSKAGNSIV